MKSNLFVISALLASANAINFGPSEQLDLQVGVEAVARSNIRQQLRNQLRSALEHDNIKFQYQYYGDDGWPGYIIPGSEPVLPIASEPIDMANIQSGAENTANAGIRAELQSNLRSFLEKNRGDAWPETILPGSEPVLPIPSDPVDLQIEALMKDGELTVEEARQKAAEMQAQMDQAVAQADQKRAEQQAQYEVSINKNDPQAQLQGLMNAQQSLHRLTSAFSAKPNLDKVTGMAQKLGIPMTPELMQLGNNEAISNALVEIAVGMGKSEAEISAALD